jgi:hypothetical protein
MGLFDDKPSKGRRKRLNKERCCYVILRRIATSNRSITKICKKKYLPSPETFYCWLEADRTLAEHYAKARRQQIDYMAEQILELAENDNRNPLAVRNHIDANKWLCSKLRPEKYGDKLDISGTVQVQHDDVTSLQTALALHHILQQIQARRDGGQLSSLT